MKFGIQRAALWMVMALCTQSTWAGQSGQGTTQTFIGEITDSYCAKNGSHAELMSQMKSMGHDKKTCTMKCIEMGAKLVLFDPAHQAIYKLDSPEKAFPFAGQKVRITGTLHKNELTVETIENMN